MNVTDVIYHGGCPDGFTSAWLLKQAFPGASLHPAGHGDPPPEIGDGTVVIADFSYKRPVLVDFANSGVGDIIILDHHKTAQDDLVDLPANVHVTFDMDRSGAQITWDWINDNGFHNSLTRIAEKFVNYVQDQDLWRKELPHTDEVSAYYQSCPFEIDQWSDIVVRVNSDFEGVVTAGRTVKMYQTKILDIVEKSAREVIIDGYKVLAASIPYPLGSLLAERLCTGENEGRLFGAYYIHHPWGTQWGLRSRSDFSVREVAERFGGGGHDQAAGFKIEGDWGFEGVKVGSVF